MKKSLWISFAAVFLISQGSSSQLALAMDKTEKSSGGEQTGKPTMKRTASEEELFQLLEKKEALLKQQERLKKEERHGKIEKLKKEIQEIEAANMLLQNKLFTQLSEEKDQGESVQSTFYPIESTHISLAAIPSSSREDLLERIIENYEGILESMWDENALQSNRYLSLRTDERIIYHLAKRCHSKMSHVQKIVGALVFEKSLSPSIDLIKNYVRNQLHQPFEKGKLYSDSVSFQNVDFTTKLYITGYDSQLSYKYDLSDRFHIADLNNKQGYESQVHLGEDIKEKMIEHLEGHKLGSSYFYKNNVYFNYIFWVIGESQKVGLVHGGPLIGFFFLQKQIDAHLFLH